MRTNVSTAHTYRPDIDGMRAFAVLSVVAFHAFPWALPGGFVGVDVFFVISGFLITGILLGQERFSISAFYVRRAKRIFPALTLVLASCLLAGWVLLTPEELRSLGKHTLAGALFASNLAYSQEAGGYFNGASETKPLLHLWSLGVEEQYYLAWPLFVAVLRKHPRAFLVGTALLVVASLGGCAYLTIHRPSAAFFFPLSRFWELGIGGLLATVQGQTRSTPLSAQVRAALSWGGAALLLLGVIVIHQGKQFPGFWATLPVLGATALILSGPDTLLGRVVLGSRVMVAVGLISYPLYLWHWPLLSFGWIIWDSDFSAGMRVVACTLSLGLATATYLFIERPVRLGTKRRWSSPASLSFVMVLIACAGAFLWVRTPAPEPLAGRDDTCPAALKGGKQDRLNLCVATGSAPVVALVGDSHAEHLFDALARSDARPWLLMGNTSCPPVLGVNVEGSQKGCAQKFERIMRFLRSSDAASIELVALSMYSGYGSDESFAADHLRNHLGPDSIAIDGKRSHQDKQPLFERGLQAFVSDLLSAGKRVIILEDVPEFPVLAGRCVTSPQARALLQSQLGGPERCSQPRGDVQRRQAAFLGMTERIVGAMPQVRLFPTLDYLCSPTTCPMATAGQLLYSDSHHLSPEGARKLAPRILDMLRAELPPVR
jgi:peptidoglycan/LPS O-acetylase OafA/YrhL